MNSFTSVMFYDYLTTDDYLFCLALTNLYDKKND